MASYQQDTSFLDGGGALGALIARHDWASTSLGPIDRWPQSLRTTVAIVLRSPIPMAVLWGPRGVMIYNDAYAVIAGHRHPELLGATLHDAWPEVADFNDHILREALSGRTISLRDQQLVLERDRRPEPAWFNLDYSPVLDEDGRPAGVLAIVAETTDRMVAEQKAALESARRQRMFEQAPGFICILGGPDYVLEFSNLAHRQLFGDQHIVGRPIFETLPDILDEELRGVLDRVYCTGQRHVANAARLRLRQSGGQVVERFADFVLEPLTDETGAVTGIFCEGFEVTDQVRARAAIQESERRLSAAVTIARLGAFEWDLDSHRAILDERAREIFGFAMDQALTIEDVVARIDPRDVSRVFAQAHPGMARREMEYRICRPDGTIRTLVSMSDSFMGPDGRAQRIIGVFDDVTERRRAEKRQRLLINELNHRVKNTLATVQSIAAQTLRSAPDLPTARASFESRLLALSGAHDLLTAESWHGARISDIVASAIAPFDTTRRRISAFGVSAWVTAQRALALSMALHELATNAAKYGALSRAEGRIVIEWALSGADELTLSWVEEGGPPVEAPRHGGFGSRLLQRSLARELDGEVSVYFAPEGVRCEIRCRIVETRPSSTADMIEV